jgi:hypothetical protein
MDLRGQEAPMRLCIALLALVMCVPAVARDFGRWEAQSGHVRQWFKNLMQPDNPHVSCCGEADAYWADSFEVEGDRYVAIITDDRDMPGRPPIAAGTKLVVPNYKMKWDEGNPTGHGVIFVGTHGQIYCYIAPGGV